MQFGHAMIYIFWTRRSKCLGDRMEYTVHTLPNVNPTAEQLAILADTDPGFRLIRGAAGSGKTTTALLRLRQLCRARIERQARIGRDELVRVLVLTFNRTLRGYINALASEQITTSDRLDITVDTFGHWAWELVGRRHVLNNSEQSTKIQALLRSIGVDAASLAYFTDEINYILGRFLPENRQQYLGIERTGRGRAPAVTRQTRAGLLDDVIRPYEAQKAQNNVVDWNDVAIEAANVGDQAYDVVVVDETQDFSANQLRAIRAHLKEDHATTFIMDAVQRIYPQSFQWREIDIEMRPQMVFTLARNHRNTAEIARLAASLVRDLPVEEDGVLPDAEACQQSGHKPKVLAGTYSNQFDYMLNHIQTFLDSGDTVAVLQPRGGRWFDYARGALPGRAIPYCELTQKREWPAGPEQVALSTIHSAKGLEFDHVLLPGLSQEVTPHGEEAGDGQLDSLRRLVAMGIGRAAKTVLLGYKPGEQSTLIEFLDPTTYDLVGV